jgi:hypothetical protein
MQTITDKEPTMNLQYIETLSLEAGLIELEKLGAKEFIDMDEESIMWFIGDYCIYPDNGSLVVESK